MRKLNTESLSEMRLARSRYIIFFVPPSRGSFYFSLYHQRRVYIRKLSFSSYHQCAASNLLRTADLGFSSLRRAPSKQPLSWDILVHLSPSNPKTKYSSKQSVSLLPAPLAELGSTYKTCCLYKRSENGLLFFYDSFLQWTLYTFFHITKTSQTSLFYL